MNKKLSQLTEKVTSLSADDLLYVSVNGVSKSIKASTVEAPLKAYADQKKSELISEIEDLDAKINTEITNRQAADASNLEVAKAYTDSEITAIQSVNSAILYDANAYTDSEIQALNTELAAEKENLLYTISSTYVTSADMDTSLSQFEAQQSQFVSEWLSSELTNRQSGDATTLQSAKDYTDAQVLAEQTSRQAAISSEQTSRQSAISTEQSARQSGDATTLQSAKDYTDAAVAGISASSGSSPTGAIHLYAGSSAPTGYLLCDGSAVSRTVYAALYAVIGTNYGIGNGSTTFNLPNPDGNSNIKMIIKV